MYLSMVLKNFMKVLHRLCKRSNRCQNLNRMTLYIYTYLCTYIGTYLGTYIGRYIHTYLGTYIHT
jgi:hypothetical protein